MLKLTISTFRTEIPRKHYSIYICGQPLVLVRLKKQNKKTFILTRRTTCRAIVVECPTRCCTSSKSKRCNRRRQLKRIVFGSIWSQWCCVLSAVKQNAAVNLHDTATLLAKTVSNVASFLFIASIFFLFRPSQHKSVPKKNMIQSKRETIP